MDDRTTTVTVEKLVQGGWGLGRRGRRILFVQGAIPEEVVSVRLGSVQKGFQKATIERVLVASPDRVAPPCEVYGQCGGCRLQHLRYEAQLKQKRAILQETMARIGKMTVGDVPPIVPSPEPYGYRSTIRFAVVRKEKDVRLAFHQEGTHDHVPAGRCLLAPDEIRRTAEALQARLSRRPQSADRLKAIEIRRSAAFQSILLLCRTECGTSEQAEAFVRLLDDVPDLTGIVVQGLHRRRWVYGRDWIIDRLAGMEFRVGERSFMQANWLLNETLVNTIAEWASPSPGLRILELYAGIGSLGLLCAKCGALVTQVEGNRSAAADARYAADVNRIDRCRVRLQSVEAMLRTAERGEYDLAIADPPRTGLSRPSLQGLIRLGLPRMLYLSCDVPTLARDLDALCRSGYRIIRLQAFDMFPQTAHLETLVELCR